MFYHVAWIKLDGCNAVRCAACYRDFAALKFLAERGEDVHQVGTVNKQSLTLSVWCVSPSYSTRNFEASK
jgi:hypothetical protein